MLNKSSQMVENQCHLALTRGRIKLPAALDRNDLVSGLSDPEQRTKLESQYPDLCSDLRRAFKEVQIFRRQLASFIKQITLAPSDFGVDITLRDGQRAALLGVAERMRLGMHRPVVELPTGSGKSHVLGVIVRAYLEAERFLKNQLPMGDWSESEILVLTSRRNLVDQLAQKARPEDLQLGDLRKWTEQIVPEERFRILVAGATSREASKDALVTVMTYQGVSAQRLERPAGHRPVGLVVCDESHNATERTRGLINTHSPGAFVFGASATVLGPRRNPFLFFEAAGEISDARSWSDNVAHRDTLISCIERGELKRPRYVEARVKIDLDDALGEREDWNEETVASYISRNVDALKEVMREVLSQDISLLTLSSSPSIRDRTHMVFVKRVGLAEELAKFACEELGLRAGYTYGGDPDYEQKKAQLESGDLNMLIACKKLTEGFDVKRVNAVWLLWPHAETSEWMLTQEIGRGLRFDPQSPEGDCLLIDGVYMSKRHELASVLGVFDSPVVFNGGLLSPGAQRALEEKIVALLQAGGDFSELTEDEREQARQLGWKVVFDEGADEDADNHRDDDTEEEDVGWSDQLQHLIESIQVIERDDIAELLKQRRRSVSRDELAQLLADAGFPDRLSLLTVNPARFVETTIGDRKGYAFYTFATGRAAGPYITKEHMRALADLVYPASVEDERDSYRAILKEYGINNRLDLLMIDPNEFVGRSYSGLGGKAFYALVTGQKLGVGGYLTSSSMREIADVLYPVAPDEPLEPFRELLTKYGYDSRLSLLSARVKLFSNQQFDGKTGRVLYTLITGKTVGTGVGFSKAHLAEIADLLYPSSRETEIREIRGLLSEAGYSSRLKLLQAPPRVFERQLFGTRSGRVVYSILTEEMTGVGVTFSSDHLQRMADIVYPGGPESELAEQRQMAIDAGFSTAQDLLALNPNKFYQVTFGTIKGLKFFGMVMNRTLRNCTKADLQALAERLFGEQ